MHDQVSVHHYPHVLFCKVDFQWLSPQQVLVPGVVSAQLQVPAVPVEFHEVSVSPFVQSVQISLDSIRTL